MFSCVVTGAIRGVESYMLRIETDISDGLPMFSMVGFVSAQVREAQERVRVALKNAGIRLPPKRITVNFTPADIPKKDLTADLPIAIALLEAMQYLGTDAAEGILVLGGLSLDGEVTPIRGVLPMVRKAAEEGFHTVLLPRENAREAAAWHRIRAIGIGSLEDAIRFFRLPHPEREKEFPPEPPFSKGDAEVLQRSEMDFRDICGQEGVKRALEIAAAGFHNVLMVGPPGSGKSVMAKCLPGILPPLSLEEQLEVSSIYSIAGRLSPGDPFIRTRPFLAPHHSITRQALVGGGLHPTPGVISLAHRGVLFLDELTEFQKDSLNLLRQPLEEHHIVISRSTGSYDFPARFMLIGAANPCPCGYYPDSRCCCTQADILHYQSRIPGPILDRIDIMADAPRVPVDALLHKRQEEGSSCVRRRVMQARERQKERFRQEKITFNAEMSAPMTDRYCRLGGREKKFVKEIFCRMNLSARAFYRILKVARTIADLDGAPEITEDHLAEAAGYRCREYGRAGERENPSGRMEEYDEI